MSQKDAGHEDEEAPADERLAFLTTDDILALHEASIRRFSPTESTALRDAGLLESAVMSPQQTFGGQYLNQSLAEMAAAYLVSLAQNHAFENGNRRIAFIAGSVFLRINGYRLTLTQDEAVALTFNVVNRVWDKEAARRVIEAGIEEL